MTSHSTDQSDLVQNPGAPASGSTNIPWLTFSGAPHESVNTFIQSVQRVALQLNNMFEDGWIAHYAAACFMDDSLLWYLDLDEETCNSWRKLRRALVQQYGTGIRNAGPPSTGPAPGPQDWGTRQSSVGRPTTQTAPSAPNAPRERRGKIEVFIHHYPKTVGFLAYDAVSSNFSIVPHRDRAQVVSFPQNSRRSPFSIRMEGPQAETPYLYVGLVLVNNRVDPPHAVPPILLTGINSTEYINAPSLCFPYYPRVARSPRSSDPVTWIFRACGESSPIPHYRRIARAIDPRDRASATVWTYDENTNQLSMIWMNDNDAEVELAAIVLDGEQASLRIRQIRDCTDAVSHANEFQVKLLFVPEESD